MAKREGGKDQQHPVGNMSHFGLIWVDHDFQNTFMNSSQQHYEQLLFSTHALIIILKIGQIVSVYTIF